MQKTHLHLNAFTQLYLDDDILVIHKPAGLLVHPSPMDKHEILFANQLAKNLIQQKVYTVHRLDKPTSGILMFALSSEIARDLSNQFSEHRIQKEYVALCRGWSPQQGHISKPLLYQVDKKMERNKQTSEPQPAETNYIRLATATLDQPLNQHEQQRYSLIKLIPTTGRKHQLRRHLNHINHPIIGDVKHGDRHHNKLFNDTFDLHRLYLAATKITFTHPRTQQAICINAPMQDDFLQTLHKLNMPCDLALYL